VSDNEKDKKKSKKLKKIAEHRTYAQAAAKAHAPKPNAAARRRCNRWRQAKKDSYFDKMKGINKKKISNSSNINI
jgi:hypothetical protein